MAKSADLAAWASWAPKAPLHKVHLCSDTGISERAGNLQCVGPSFAGAGNCDHGILFMLCFTKGYHHPVKPDGKPAGRNIVPAEKVGEAVRATTKDLVLCSQVLCKSFKDHARIVVKSTGDTKIQ